MRGNDTRNSNGLHVYSDFSLSFRSQFARRLLDGICRLIGNSKDFRLHCQKQPLISPKPDVNFAWRVVMKSSQESCFEFPHCQRVARSFTQLAPCNKTHYDCVPLDNAQANKSLAAETDLFAYLWSVL